MTAPVVREGLSGGVDVLAVMEDEPRMRVRNGNRECARGNSGRGAMFYERAAKLGAAFFAVAELIAAAEETARDAAMLGMSTPRLRAALAAVKGGAL